MGSQYPDDAPERARRYVGDDEGADAVRRAVAAFAHALRLSCSAARRPATHTLANEAIAAHRTARACAERAVEEAARRGRIV